MKIFVTAETGPLKRDVRYIRATEHYWQRRQSSRLRSEVHITERNSSIPSDV